MLSKVTLTNSWLLLSTEIVITSPSASTKTLLISMVSVSASSLTTISSITSLTIGKSSTGLTITVKSVSTVSPLAVPVRVIIACADSFSK